MTSNYLVTGVSGSGKTAVARELARRGFAAVDAAAPLAEVADALTAPRPTCRG